MRQYLTPPITIQPLNFKRNKYSGGESKINIFPYILKKIILFAVVQNDQIKQRSVPKSVPAEAVSSLLKIIEYKNANIIIFSLNLPKIFPKTVAFS